MRRGSDPAAHRDPRDPRGRRRQMRAPAPIARARSAATYHDLLRGIFAARILVTGPARAEEAASVVVAAAEQADAAVALDALAVGAIAARAAIDGAEAIRIVGARTEAAIVAVIDIVAARADGTRHVATAACND